MKSHIQHLFLLLALCTVVYQAAAQNFVIASSPHVSAEPITICAADVNGDGKVDLIYGSHNGSATSMLAVLTNNGSGGFATSVTYGLGRSDDHGMLIGSLICLTTADVNRDGMVDLIYGTSDGLTVLTNNGIGGFATSGTYGLGILLSSPAYGSGAHRVPSCLTTADVNGDGKVDLICGDQDGLTVLTNNGSGGFVIASLCRGSFPTSICAAEVNGDGKMDLICAHQGEFNLTVLTNDGTGGFALTSTLKIRYPTCLCVADVNGDGKADLISGSQIDGALTVLTNNGSGSFVFASTLPVRTGPVSVIAADVNGDGKVDLISANFNSSTLSVLMNNGRDGFARASTVTLKEGSNPYSVCAADVNGDGRVDLITANFNNSTLTVLTNSGSVADVSTNVGTNSSVKPVRSFNKDAVVAKGNGFEIKEGELMFGIRPAAPAAIPQDQTTPVRAQVPPEFEEAMALNQLIHIHLLLPMTTAADMAEGKKNADAGMAAWLKRAGSQELFDRQLKTLGVTADELRAKATQEATAMATLIRELGVVVTDAEVKTSYDSNSSEFQRPDAVHIRQILLRTMDPVTSKPMPDDQIKAKRKQIDDIYTHVRAGEDFATLAKQYSESAQRDNGGEITLSRGQMSQAFEAAVFSLSANQISDVITTPGGFRIVKMLDKIPAAKLALTDKSPFGDMTVAEKIKDDLTRKKTNALAWTYLNKLAANANVEILDPALAGPAWILEANAQEARSADLEIGSHY